MPQPTESPILMMESPADDSLWQMPDGPWLYADTTAVSGPDTLTASEGVIDQIMLVEGFDPQPAVEPAPLWILGVLVFNLGILGFLRLTAGKRLRQLLNAFFSNRFIQQMIREEQAYSNRVTLFLTLIFLLSSSLFVTLINESEGYSLFGFVWTPIPVSPFLFFLCALSGITVFLFIKTLLFRLSGALFKVQPEISEYLFHFQLFLSAQGVFLIPILIAAVYMPVVPDHWVFTLGMALLAGSFFARITRGFYLAAGGRGLSWFYIILYLCTFEILPLVVVSKPLLQVTT